MGHTASNIETDISLLLSILNVFDLFQMLLLYYKHNEEEHVVEAISIKCSNYHRNTGLYLKDTTVE